MKPITEHNISENITSLRQAIKQADYKETHRIMIETADYIIRLLNSTHEHIAPDTLQDSKQPLPSAKITDYENFDINLKEFLYALNQLITSNFYGVFIQSMPPSLINPGIIYLTFHKTQKTFTVHLKIDNRVNTETYTEIDDINKQLWTVFNQAKLDLTSLHSTLLMTDRSLVQSIAQIFGCKSYHPELPKNYWILLTKIKQCLLPEFKIHSVITDYQKKLPEFSPQFTASDIKEAILTQKTCEIELDKKLMTQVRKAWDMISERNIKSIADVLATADAKTVKLIEKKSITSSAEPSTKKETKEPSETHKTEAVSTIARFWRTYSQRPYLVTEQDRSQNQAYNFLFSPLTSVKDEKKSNTSPVQILRSMNAHSLTQLRTALTKREWWLAIEEGPEISRAAITLFKYGEISSYQLDTLLMRAQVYEKPPQESEQSLQKTYHILDEKNDFAAETKMLFLAFKQKPSPKLGNSIDLTDFNEWHLPLFKRAIMALPLSEQIFYTSKPDKVTQYSRVTVVEEEEDKKNKPLSLEIDLHNLNMTLFGEINSTGVIIHLAAGVQNALLLILYGQELIPSPLRMGPMSIRDIRNSVTHGLRPASIYPPGIIKEYHHTVLILEKWPEKLKLRPNILYLMIQPDVKDVEEKSIHVIAKSAQPTQDKTLNKLAADQLQELFATHKQDISVTPHLISERALVNRIAVICGFPVIPFVIHAEIYPSGFWVTHHDRFHQHRMTMFGQSGNLIYDLFIQALTKIGKDMCAEISFFTDRDLFYFRKFRGIQNRTQQCCFLLFNKGGNPTNNKQFFHSIETWEKKEDKPGTYIKTAGLIVLLHFVENAETLKDKQIYLDEFEDTAKANISVIKQLLPYLKDDPLPLQVFKIILFLHLNKNLRQFKTLCHKIDDYPDFKQHLAFTLCQSQEVNDERHQYSLLLKFEGRILSPLPSQNNWLEPALKQTFESQPKSSSRCIVS